jgi:hypothetical protein
VRWGLLLLLLLDARPATVSAEATTATATSMRAILIYSASLH